MRIMSVVGTRPEAIKMGPVIKEIQRAEGMESVLCLTGQHVEPVSAILDLFAIESQLELAKVHKSPTLGQSFAAVTVGVERAITRFSPDIVLVQGDTTTTAAAAIASFYSGVDVGHIEAGLRTYNLGAPWPEEGNRQVVSRLTKVHFAPSITARENLIREGLPKQRVHVIGNTVIDALLHVRDEVLPYKSAEISKNFPWVDKSKHLLLITGHRRENHTEGLRGVCRAAVKLAERADCQIAFVKHMNPALQVLVDVELQGVEGVFLLDPQPYASFLWLMENSSLIITDSGGIQEEAPMLGTPVLVTRETTERPEAAIEGTALLVGAEESKIFAKVTELLDNPIAMDKMRRIHQPYGGGGSARKVVDILRRSI